MSGNAAKGEDGAHVWEAVDGGHMWEGVQEDEEGNIIVRGGDVTLAQAIRRRRKRQEQNDYSQRHKRVCRDMIRYVYVLIDASRWMRQKEPVLSASNATRLDVTVQLLQEFVQEYYDQNPLSHLGFVVLQDGEAEIVAPLSSSGSKSHQLSLKSVSQMALAQPAGGGEFSLQNGLEVAGRSLGHQPRHGSREIVLLTSALTTCDPGSILTETLPKLQRSKIRFSCFALTAELHICRKIAESTKGTMGVCLDRPHYREWLLQQCVPPPTSLDGGIDGVTPTLSCEMISMGFPTRTTAKVPSLVHATRHTTLLSRHSYICPQCQAKNSTLPVDCAVCGLKLVLAPHLARSFHHLFPVSAFLERPATTGAVATPAGGGDNATTTATMGVSSSTPSSVVVAARPLDSKLLITSEDDETCCYACLKPLGTPVVSETNKATNSKSGKASKFVSKTTTTLSEELLRFQCPDCRNYFCVDCDAYLHETLHNCPGCLCLL